MSKQKIAPTRGEGIPTPASVAESTKPGNSPAFSAAAFAEALGHTFDGYVFPTIKTATERLEFIELLGRSIRDEAASSRPLSPGRIKNLADIILLIAGNAIDLIGSEEDDLRDNQLPRLLASLPEGGAV